MNGSSSDGLYAAGSAVILDANAFIALTLSMHAPHGVSAV